MEKGVGINLITPVGINLIVTKGIGINLITPVGINLIVENRYYSNQTVGINTWTHDKIPFMTTFNCRTSLPYRVRFTATK